MSRSPSGGHQPPTERGRSPISHEKRPRVGLSTSIHQYKLHVCALTQLIIPRTVMTDVYIIIIIVKRNHVIVNHTENRRSGGKCRPNSTKSGAHWDVYEGGISFGNCDGAVVCSPFSLNLTPESSSRTGGCTSR